MVWGFFVNKWQKMEQSKVKYKKSENYSSNCPATFMCHEANPESYC